MDKLLCPCGTGKLLIDCCQPYLLGKKFPPTAETLMRSRYTAFTQGAIDYLKQTLLPRAQVNFDEVAARQWAEQSTWLKLEIKRIEQGHSIDHIGVVEFIAHYKIRQQKFMHHEISNFVKDATTDQWFFVDGKIIVPMPLKSITPVKFGRNEICVCGSGKKYKKCGHRH